MPLDFDTYREQEQVATVHLDSGEHFDFGYYPALLTRDWVRRLWRLGNSEDEADLDESEELLASVFAWWDILDNADRACGEPSDCRGACEAVDCTRWPVDVDHLRRLPGPLFDQMVQAIRDETAEEGKGSASG